MKDTLGMERFLLKPKPTAIMLCLKDKTQIWYHSKLAEATGASYVYVTTWLGVLEELKWIKHEKKGRLMVVSTTEKCDTAIKALEELIQKTRE